MVFSVEEPAKYQLKKFDKIFPDVVDSTLQHLYIRLNVKNATLEDVNNFIDEMNFIDDDINIGCLHGLIDFDYYITLDLLPKIRDLVRKYEHKKFIVEVWQFGID